MSNSSPISVDDIGNVREILCNATQALAATTTCVRMWTQEIRDTPLRDCLDAFSLVHKCGQLAELRGQFLNVFGPTQESNLGEFVLDAGGSKRIEAFWFLCARAAAESGQRGALKSSVCKRVAEDLIATAGQGRLIINWWERTGVAQFKGRQDHAEKVALRCAEDMAGNKGRFVLTMTTQPNIAESITGELACVLTYLPREAMSDAADAGDETPRGGKGKRRGRLPKDESEARKKALLVKVVRYPSMLEDIPALAQEAGVSQKQARRWATEFKNENLEK